MKCEVCGNQSGKYPLCRLCNDRKIRGEIIKCSICKKWHYASSPCPIQTYDPNSYLYNAKNRLISATEQRFYEAILQSLPTDYHVFPQVNLASFIIKTDNSRFQNELFRNVDFLVTNDKYQPLFIVEINDQTHLTPERKERDEKVRNICEEAGIPLLCLWTSYGVNLEYIHKRILEVLSSLPVTRIHHFQQIPAQPITPPYQQPIYPSYQPTKSKGACYIATCVYGSYNAPQVLVLRRFRDKVLLASSAGRLFIRIYYSLSPKLVKCFGKYTWFHRLFQQFLNSLVEKLEATGLSHDPYDGP